LRAGRAGGAEGDAAELQLGGSRAGALSDEVERKVLGFGVLALLQHFQAVDDRAHRADQVVADARAEKRGKIERLQGDGGGHG
jgi:hypothetical protein